jgi:mannose-1-phosphate guanylyltransferase
MAQLMVLAAGLGTRLRPLTDELPKPLVPVGDAPLLEHILRRGAALGLSSAVVNAHWCKDQLHAYSATWNRGLTIFDEPTLLGTAGGICQARSSLTAPVLVWNGDIWANPLPEQWHTAKLRAEPTLFVAPCSPCETPDVVSEQGRSAPGTLGLDRAGHVVRLRGERFGEEARAADYIGLMVLPTAALAALPERGCYVGDFLLPWLRAGRRVHTEWVSNGWAEIGSVDSYWALNQRWLAESGQANYVAKAAQVDPAMELDRTIVGAGATIVGRGRVSECVIWPGAQVVAPVSRSIVTMAGRVVPRSPGPV